MSESHSERSITSTGTSIVRAAGDVYPSLEEPEVDGGGFKELIARLARAQEAHQRGESSTSDSP
jgi:hypothetical protein